MVIGPHELDKAIAVLEQNDVLAIPTETVYGLAGNLFSEAAVAKIFDLKQRPRNNPLIVHLHNESQVFQITDAFPPLAQKLATAFWPGPLTLALKKSPSVPDLVTAGKDTVAVRIPDHPLTLKLLQKLPFPIAAPSANPFNRISPTSAAHVEGYFGAALTVLDGGECSKGIESTIIGFENDEPLIYRLGSIAVDAIEAVIGPVRIQNQAKKAPSAPGMLEKHYSPRTKTYLVDDANQLLGQLRGKKIGLLRFTGGDIHPNISHMEVLSSSGSLEEATANLYAALHKLDHLQLDAIVAVRMPDEGLGRSMNDRLERAAK